MFRKIILRFLFFKNKEFFLEERNIKDFFLISIIGGILLNFFTLSLIVVGIFSLIYIKNIIVEIKKNYWVNFFNINLSGRILSVICIGFILIYWVTFINEDFFISYLFIFSEFNWLIFLKVYMSNLFFYQILFSKKCGC